MFSYTGSPRQPICNAGEEAMGSKAPMNVKSVFLPPGFKASGPVLFRNRQDSRDTERW